MRLLEWKLMKLKNRNHIMNLGKRQLTSFNEVMLVLVQRLYDEFLADYLCIWTLVKLNNNAP